MVKDSNLKKKKKDGDNVVFGREVVDMRIKVIPEVRTKIEAFARQQNIDVDVAGGVIMEYMLAKQEALVEVAREKVTEIFNEKVERFAHAVEALIDPENLTNIPKKGQVN